MKFYTDHDCSESRKFCEFKENIVKLINDDKTLIEQAEQVNFNLAQAMKDINTNDPAFYNRIMRKAHELPRYSFIKHLEFNEKKYEAKIDLLSWEVNFFEI